VEASELTDLVDALKAAQSSDGSWSQLPDLAGDAWATGSALVALNIAGKMRTHDPVYKKGLDYLLRTQFEDGSWYVRSRTWPFQPHFDSRFPHGKDQWISAPATAWAVMAMTLAVKPENPPAAAVRGRYIGGEQRGPEGIEMPAAAGIKAEAREFDFAGRIKPIFKRSCVTCHGGDRPKAGLRFSGREALLKGGESGEPAIHPGMGSDSLLARVVSGQVEDMEMPPLSKREKYPALSEEEIKQITAWIDAGAPWPDNLSVE
jgi:mono/diheme cytochrome c family protein